MLELGSGCGSLSAGLTAAYGARCVGVDVVPQFVEWANGDARPANRRADQHANMQGSRRYCVGDIEKIADWVPCASFDLTVSYGVLHYVPTMKVIMAAGPVGQWRRLRAKPDGVLSMYGHELEQVPPAKVDDACGMLRRQFSLLRPGGVFVHINGMGSPRSVRTDATIIECVRRMRLRTRVVPDTVLLPCNATGTELLYHCASCWGDQRNPLVRQFDWHHLWRGMRSVAVTMPHAGGIESPRYDDGAPLYDEPHGTVAENPPCCTGAPAGSCPRRAARARLAPP